MDTDRLIELEIKIAYQEDLLQSLNETVSDQQEQIDRLNATCRVLSERIKSLFNQNNADESVDQTPPHY
ncbi:SlyX family protein [Crenothrix sp.]|uniref:SlyX family protein n=1 Tax=Crenothrix sp. TaxID=3100433 RepID=UPI00374D3D3B